ncbi:hypothetical protein C6P92_25220 [Burkholderia multivorans]|nr:hypothetical protein C6P92_25220 [Burkholderia multivorans]
MAGSGQVRDDADSRLAGAVTDPADMIDPNHALEAIVSDFRRLRGRMVLFIDNLDVCVDPMLPAFVERLTFHRVPDVHLVVSSVRNLPIDFVRMWSCPCNSGHADTVRLMTPHYA